MSYVIRIRRNSDAAALTEAHLRLPLAELGLSSTGPATWRFKSANSPAEFVLCLDSGELYTDTVFSTANAAAADTDASECLAKLRAIARCLGAQLIGEDGENLTEATPNSGSATGANGLATLGSVLITLLLLPIMLLLFIVRLPWLLWQITRKTPGNKRR